MRQVFNHLRQVRLRLGLVGKKYDEEISGRALRFLVFGAASFLFVERGWRSKMTVKKIRQTKLIWCFDLRESMISIISEIVSTKYLIPSDISDLYEVHEWRNATGVLSTAYPCEWKDILRVLRSFRLTKTQIITPGKNRSDISKSLDGPFTELGWVEKQFLTQIQVDDDIFKSPTHKIDCYKNNVALEIEWNNKDPFFDRDLNNFRLLFDLRAVGVGVIITRSDELQVIFNKLDKGASYGNSTTHMSKLLSRIEGGGGGGCPILAFGITSKLYDDE